MLEEVMENRGDNGAVFQFHKSEMQHLVWYVIISSRWKILKPYHGIRYVMNDLNRLYIHVYILTDTVFVHIYGRQCIQYIHCQVYTMYNDCVRVTGVTVFSYMSFLMCDSIQNSLC
jgi:hypothetical protein